MSLRGAIATKQSKKIASRHASLAAKGSIFARNDTRSEQWADKGAFSLVELLISVAILGFALVIIIQSYLTSLSGMDISKNYLAAMRWAGNKLTELKVSAYVNQGLLPDIQSGSITLGSRQFNWQAEISSIERAKPRKEDASEEEKAAEAEEDTLANRMVKACVVLNWQERNIAKDITLAAYLPKKQENEPSP